MKKLILSVSFLVSVCFYAQYNQLQVPQSNSEISSSLQYWGNQMNNLGREYRDRNERERIRQYNEEKNTLERNQYLEYYKFAKEEFEKQNYNSCIIYYNSAKKSHFYSSDFEMIAGVSYIMIYGKDGNTENLENALSTLKLAKEHGNPEAQKFIDSILKRN